ncbi:MAG TPA: hypothetical protein VMB23_00540, partial [Spirochaetia bacterium]|nr:hypothetical protein [Spirochaetia bacterium]
MFPKTTLFALLVSGLLLSCQGAGTSPEPTPVLTGPTGTFVPDPTSLVLPYTEVEAETGQTTGTFAGGSTVLHTPAAEASQRRYVSLDPGRYLELPAPIDANSLVVRYSYPDSTSGEGQTGELWGAVGAAAAVSLGVTSKYSWEYGYANWNSQTNHNSDWSDPPSAGLPRHFWDEANLRVPGFTAGTTVRITNPAGSGVTVLVDLVDFEAVPDAVPAPQGSTTFSGDSTGTQDVTASLQAALNAAAGGTLYLPEGA